MDFQLTFIRQSRFDTLEIERAGSSLIINGKAFDFAELPDGATLPQSAVDCPFLASDVRRIGGAVQMTLLLPCTTNISQADRFPAPITATVDGPIAFPAYEVTA